MKGNKKGEYMRPEDILPKLDNLEIEQIKLFKEHITKMIWKKVEAEKEREKFEDPRDDKMMSEIYPGG